MSCRNCDDQKEVSISVKCPECQGDGDLRLHDAAADLLSGLMKAQEWILDCFSEGSMPTDDDMDLLKKISDVLFKATGVPKGGEDV